MKKFYVMFLFIAALVLNACAANPAAVAKYPPDLQSKYVYAIERAAEHRATSIYWVHTPTNEELRGRLYGTPEGE